MKSLTLTAIAFVILILGSAHSLAQNAYITNFGDSSVSVIDTATNTVTSLRGADGVPLRGKSPTDLRRASA